jgi:cysteinyl-tRNA synthetase
VDSIKRAGRCSVVVVTIAVASSSPDAPMQAAPIPPVPVPVALIPAAPSPPLPTLAASTQSAQRFTRIPLAVESWAYQLQGYDPSLQTLGDSKFDLLVIDYSEFGDAASEFTAEQIAGLRNGPCGERPVVAYMSVGEAESYRYYFDSDWIGPDNQPIPGTAPDWLGPPNPDFTDNYKVKYWMAGWQGIIFGDTSGADESYLDRIIDAGFDGVYLDIIDAFEYWGPTENGGNDTNRDSAADMVDFVRAMAQYARQTRGAPGFIVIPQNGAGLIADWTYPDAADPVAEAATQKGRYFEVIDAIGAEDTFFVGPADNDNPLDPQTETIALLDEFVASGKLVLAVDYVTQAAKVQTFYDLARAHRYKPYGTVRDLGVTTVNPGHEPVCRWLKVWVGAPSRD